MHIDDARGSIIANRWGGYSCGPNQIVIYPVMELLSELIAEMTKNTHEIYIVTRQLMLDGLDYFWFCLCFLSTGGLKFPAVPSSYDSDRQEVRKLVVQKILKWWPHIVARTDRFASSRASGLHSPVWSSLASIFDIETWRVLNQSSCQDIEEYMRRWLEKQ